MFILLVRITSKSPTWLKHKLKHEVETEIKTQIERQIKTPFKTNDKPDFLISLLYPI